LNLSEPSHAVPADGSIRPVTGTVALPARDGRRIAAVSSFGWSGTNAHLVLESAPSLVDAPVAAAPAAPNGAGVQVLPVSAAGGAALRAGLERLSGWLRDR